MLPKVTILQGAAAQRLTQDQVTIRGARYNMRNNVEISDLKPRMIPETTKLQCIWALCTISATALSASNGQPIVLWLWPQWHNDGLQAIADDDGQIWR
jgi:hypothetical protein